jgi:hypothetical protein
VRAAFEVIMAWPPVLDILVYAVVLSGAPAPTVCEAVSEDTVTCTNGATGKWDPRSDTVAVDGTPVYLQNGKYVFGNGMTSSRNAFGWTAFTNGMMIRRDVLGGKPDAWLISPDLECETVTERKAECRRR